MVWRGKTKHTTQKGLSSSYPFREDEYLVDVYPNKADKHCQPKAANSWASDMEVEGRGSIPH